MTSLKTRKTSDWLDATGADDISALELLIKTRYGERHLNSLGQLLDESTVDTDGVADMIWILHKGAWDHLWTSYVAEYNPIWNVDGTTVDEEVRDLEQTHTGTDTLARDGSDTFTQGGTIDKVREGADTLTQTGTDTVVKSGSDTVTQQGTSTNANNVFAFDSVSAVPESSQTQTPNLTDTHTYNQLQDQDTKNLTNTQEYDSGETETRNTTDTTTYDSSNTQTKDLTDTDSGTVTRTITRTGNIGTTMTSQMLRDDTEYWSDMKSLFYEHVIRDIIGDICYKIYVGE